MQLRPIGIIHSKHKEQTGTPVQPVYAEDSPGRVVVDPAFQAGLKDLEGFERIWLVYWMHRSGPFRLKVVPYKDTVERGLFATRAPSRPNPIGISCVRLLSIRDNLLEVAGVDILDDTPLLDIKPYAPGFDAHPGSRAGWLQERAGQPAADRTKADDRFTS
jgi:tRNA-Thr(GGU) m(6)t(6)A37 methyltransferase TsaA